MNDIMTKCKYSYMHLLENKSNLLHKHSWLILWYQITSNLPILITLIVKVHICVQICIHNFLKSILKINIKTNMNILVITLTTLIVKVHICSFFIVITRDFRLFMPLKPSHIFLMKSPAKKRKKGEKRKEKKERKKVQKRKRRKRWLRKI